MCQTMLALSRHAGNSKNFIMESLRQQNEKGSGHGYVGAGQSKTADPQLSTSTSK